MKLPRFVQRVRSGKQITIVGYGDSISEVGRTPGWYGGASSAEANWLQHVGSILRERFQSSEFVMHNFGIGGQNTYEGLGRLDWLVNMKPDLVILEFGANDCGWHTIPPECTHLAMSTLIYGIKSQTGADVVVLGLAGDNPLKPSFEHREQTDAAIAAAAESASVLYVDMRAALVDATGGGARWDDYHCGPTDCHPNDAGHREWGKAVSSALISIEEMFEA